MLIVQRLRHTNGLQKRLLARASIMEKRGGGGCGVCAYVCVCVRVKERERKARTGTFFSLRFMPVVKQCHSSHKQAEKSSTALPVMFMCPLLENLLALLSGCSLEHQRSRTKTTALLLSGSYNAGARRILPPDLISLKLDIICYSDD